MEKNKNISGGLSCIKVTSIVIMCFCLIFLTGVNFFVYSSSSPTAISSLLHNTEPADEESPTPVEEKSSSKTGLTVQEEYIHELHSIKDLSALVVLSKHKIPEPEKLQIVHFELVSPPPKA